ncbi:Hachiman antiphage defense system protein HamA [Arthrobacter sp. SIMBA_036]|uniref:Hachiman antiphage defense system protein HamA n=2 Tax=Bacteria TaxID=2 RepID=UPI00397937C8
MDGIRLVAVADASILILESVTDEIKQALKSRLVEYCYGRVQAGEDPDYYSFDLTVDEFFKLYDSKSDKSKLGLAGELIVHLLLPHGHDRLVSACVYLNKEERNVKKGFDLTFRDHHDGGLWYGEVKSGRVNDAQTADSKVRELINIAENGLHTMFTSDVRKKRWDAAIFDADAALQTDDASSVKKLLRADFMNLKNGSAPKVKALLCAVVMHPFNLNEIDASTGEELIKSVTGRGRFDELRLLLIQQSDLEDLVGVLRESLKEAVV